MLKFLKILSFFTAVLCVAVPSFAQSAPDSLFNRDKNVSVKERPKPEYETEGIRRGIWVYRPDINIRTEFDDNVFAEDQGADDDIIFVAAPSLEIEMDRSVHGMKAFVDAETRQYSDFGDESHTNYGAGVEGRLDVRRGAFVGAGVTHRQRHEGRTAAGVARGSTEPIEFDRTDAFLRGSREFGRTRIQAEASYGNTNYDDVPLAGGLIADQDFRDRNDLGLTLRGDYAITPDRSVFARVRYLDQDYKEAGNPITRDQKGYVFEGGVDFDLTNLIRGEVGVGYLKREYSSPTRTDFDGLSYNGRLDWFATPLITVTAEGARTVRPSELLNSPAAVSERIALAADYEWRRNIVLSVRADYRDENYRDIDRTDERLTYTAGATYLMNRYVGFSLGVSHTAFDSDGLFAQTDFDNARIVVGVTLRR